MITIDVPGVTSTLAFGINDRGQIVGNYSAPPGILHGFLLHRGTFTTIDVPGAAFTGAKRSTSTCRSPLRSAGRSEVTRHAEEIFITVVVFSKNSRFKKIQGTKPFKPEEVMRREQEPRQMLLGT